MDYIKVGEYATYRVDAVKHKTLDELIEMFYLKDERTVKALYDELHKIGLTRKPKTAMKPKVEFKKPKGKDSK
tara:strand:+ start:12509 stop:12727 length:219 start_codon:yes stop_codon:yes gene_type:complete